MSKTFTCCELIKRIKTNKGTVMEGVVKNLKDQAEKDQQISPLSFGKSLQE
jgi:hypothetical protein